MIFKLNNHYILLVLITLLMLVSCQYQYQERIQTTEPDVMKDFLIDFTKKMINDEEELIDSLLGLSEIPFEKDSTGIRINIDYNINNEAIVYPEDGDQVSILYNCVVFNDIDLISDDIFLDTLTFKIGYSKQMKGLNYAIKLLKVGDKSKIVIPSYLGFGLSGYQQSVPPYSTLLLNIKLLNIKK